MEYLFARNQGSQISIILVQDILRCDKKTLVETLTKPAEWIMELKEVVDKLKGARDLPSYSSSDKSEIERLYKEVLGKEFTKNIM